MKAWLLTVGIGAVCFIVLMWILWGAAKEQSDLHMTKEEWDR